MMTATRVTVSDLFNLANMALRKNVHRFTPPSLWSQSDNAEFGEIWYPSLGCSWWENGSCNMCNYGAPISPTHEQMIQAVALGLASFERIPNILWVSAFDVLDRRDVPVEVRHQIFRLLANSSAHTIISETYPSIVTYDKVKECVDLLSGKNFSIEIGVESTNEFIRTWCIHKNFTNNHIHRAISQTKQAGAEIYFNLLVGIPFLSMEEAIDDAVSSIRQSLQAGADSVVIFPCHVKEHTLCDWLYRRGLFQPPSLWAIVETILRCPAEYRSRIKPVWLKAKKHPGFPVAIKPTLDHESEKAFMDCLLQFNNTGNADFFTPLLQSSSYRQWQLKLIDAEKDSIHDRIANALQCIGTELLDGIWWKKNGNNILQLLAADWNTYQKT